MTYQQTLSENFLRNNRKLIISMANKRFGVNNYNADEIMSIALLAYHRACLKKRDNFKKAKRESVFVWYLKKEFDKLYKIGVTESRNRVYTDNGNEDTGYKHHSGPVPEWNNLDDGFYEGLLDACNWTSLEDNTAPHNSASHFGICIESFRDKNISKKLFDTLLLFNDEKEGVAKLRKAYRCKSFAALCQKIRDIMYTEINDKALFLYRGRCMNGCLSNVVVCAASPAEAQVYFRKYGKLLEVSKLSFLLPGQ